MQFNRTISLIAILIFSTLLISNSAYSKELTSRLGVGYSNQFGSAELPSIAVRYYSSSRFGLGASLGIDTEKDNSKFGFLAKIFRIIFVEDNMNFYMGSAVGVTSNEVAGKNNSGFELTGFVGGEYFFTGLDSLGFSFEAGIGVTSVSSQVRFRTIGDSPLKAGITFYF